MKKLELVTAFLYWTINFIYSDSIEVKGARKEPDYFIVLVEYLQGDERTKPVCDDFL